MPRYPNDFETDPARNPDGDREDDGRERDLEGDDLEPDRSVARHTEDAEEAEEAELAEEDILEIAELEDELEARKGEGNDA